MEKNSRFRNHISIVVERTAGLWLAMLFLGLEFLEDPEFIYDVQEDGAILLYIGLGIAILFGIVIMINVFSWYRTFISLQEHAIVIEVGTLTKHKNTIGIKNISNVNLEQNLFEMLIGTSKVKLNTDSLSTADKTDVKIVLKKKDAEEFKRQILCILNETVMEEPVQQQAIEAVDVGDELSKMLVHGLCSISAISVGIMLGSFGGVYVMLRDIIGEGFRVESLVGVLSSVIVVGFLGLSMFWNIVGGFIKYYNFKVDRIKDKLHIRYGLLKKVDYTIPVERINALRLIQSPQARLTKRYMVEIINVGMKDEEEETDSFLLLYNKKETILSEIQRLLPEFKLDVDAGIQKQSKDVWIIWILSMALYAAFLVIVNGVVAELATDWLKWVVLGSAVLTVLLLISKYAGYKTEGIALSEDCLQICEGGFGRQQVFMKYDKIQYMEVEQNFLAKKFQLVKMDAYLLAGGSDKLQRTCYFPESQVEIIKYKIMKKY